jgi:serine/threonine-protein kinase
MTACPHCHERTDDAASRFCGHCGAELSGRMAAQDAAGGVATGRGGGGGDAATTDPWLGRVIAGRYRVLGRLGSGGMGVVYKVEHTSMGKIAALKMLQPLLTAEREVVKRFRTEARAVSLLTHPNTVQVFDFGEADGGNLYMVMELVRGEDLATVLAREGPLPWPRVARLLEGTCEALAEAHEAGVVHRDLKPENLLVRRDRDGREHVKVLDFGLARLREQDQPPGVTSRGLLIGTPYYMAPEQIAGEEPDGRSDIYALGAMAYRMLTGTFPFDGPTPMVVLSKHLSDQVEPPSERRPDLDIDPRVDALVLRCMARDREARFPTADALRHALRALRKEVTPREAEAVVRPVTIESQTSKVARLSRADLDGYEKHLRRRWWWLAAVPLVAAALATGGYWWWARAGAGAVEVEVEPNDTPAQANAIALGRTVRGHIGKRLGPDESDRDVYRFTVEGEPAVLRVELTGIPNMDLHLAVFDGTGTGLAETDAGGMGDGEVIPNLRVAPGMHYVAVRETWETGRPPVEDLHNWYTLQVSARPLSPDEETEPDDTPATALPLALGQPVTGYLGRAGDVDFFAPRVEPGGPVGGGTLEGRVSGIAGVDLALVTVPADAAFGGPPSLAALRAAPGARVFDGGGPGAPDSFTGVPWPAGTPAPLVVVVRKDPPPDSAGHRPPIVGTDVRYSLIVEHKP